MGCHIFKMKFLYRYIVIQCRKFCFNFDMKKLILYMTTFWASSAHIANKV